MSSKSTIFLTRDNEHCFEDVNEWDEDKNGYTIYLEIEKQNVKVTDQGSHYFLEIKPGSHFHKIICELKNIDEDSL